ncbi:MAG: exo-alpha-sialidase [Burkholderiaceae bacterium]|nr:exo-alpha-sialidase [Burkholderiaceae bacterium]
MQHHALISTRKGLFELSCRNGEWRLGATHFLGDPLSMALYDPRDGATYAALNLGHFGVKLHRRDKGSDSWTEIAVPTYPPQPEDFNEEHPWALKVIWSLAHGGADQPGVLWAGTLPGGLFRSNDRGDSWELVRSLWDMPERKEWMGGGYEAPGIHSICVDPRNSDRILIGVSSGGAWVTEDGGEDWVVSAEGMRADYMPPERADDQGIQDPHRIVQCQGAPEVYWCQHHCGIWRSANNGKFWDRIEPDNTSAFGFAVASHPRDPNTAWFVPSIADMKRIPANGAMSVTRTRDGGKTFDVLRKGLPQQHCYDLVYRHSLALADDGQTLLIGSTTGGLWGSTNAGDDWQLISANLPPIYALQFA